MSDYTQCDHVECDDADCPETDRRHCSKCGERMRGDNDE